MTGNIVSESKSVNVPLVKLFKNVRNLHFQIDDDVPFTFRVTQAEGVLTLRIVKEE